MIHHDPFFKAAIGGLLAGVPILKRFEVQGSERWTVVCQLWTIILN
jgi:hypothetical protein